MHIGKFVLAQITEFPLLRQFRGVVAKYNDQTKGLNSFYYFS